MALRRKHARPAKPPAQDEDDPGFEAPPANPQLTAMAKVAERFKGWRPAREVLTKVRAVPTNFVQVDRATRCGGWPIERFAVVHGPSGHGKTIFTHGLGLSFLQRGHYYANIDAEYTTPEDWLLRLMASYADHPGFVAKRPETYEETVDAVRSLVTVLRAARDGGELPVTTSALTVVDSIRKLVPEDFWAKIHKQGAAGAKGSVDGMGGRGAMIKAKMNADWLDELTPLLYHTHTGMVAIAREGEDTNASAQDKMYGRDWKMTGGKALEFDASLVVRITRAAYVHEKEKKKGEEDDGEKSRVFGERHKVTIRKTKVGGKDDKAIVCYFHTSNGVLIPEGFDRARDVLELAEGYSIVEKTEGSSWLRWQGMRWQGRHAAVKKLTERPDALVKLEAQVRARFAPDEELPVAREDE